MPEYAREKAQYEEEITVCNAKMTLWQDETLEYDHETTEYAPNMTVWQNEIVPGSVERAEW